MFYLYFVIAFLCLELLYGGPNSANFNYYNAGQWTGFCASPTLQLSPINIETNLLGDDMATLMVKELPKIKNFNPRNELIQKDGNWSMNLKYESQDVVMSFQFQNVHYKLDSIHSHWGASEHQINGKATQGNYHLVFTGDSPESLWGPLKKSFAVIELMIEFVNYPTEAYEKGYRHPVCPTLEGLTDSNTPCEAGTNSPKTKHEDNCKESCERTILEALGLKTDLRHVELYHYVGSLTTPGCDGPVQWLVIPDPVTVYDPNSDWNGCQSFAKHFNHVEGTCDAKYGNNRPLQNVQNYTIVNPVRVTTEDTIHSRPMTLHELGLNELLNEKSSEVPIVSGVIRHLVVLFFIIYI